MDEITRHTTPKQDGRIARQARAAATTIAFAFGVAGAGVLGSGTGCLLYTSDAADES